MSVSPTNPYHIVANAPSFEWSITFPSNPIHVLNRLFLTPEYKDKYPDHFLAGFIGQVNGVWTYCGNTNPLYFQRDLVAVFEELKEWVAYVAAQTNGTGIVKRDSLSVRAYIGLQEGYDASGKVHSPGEVDCLDMARMRLTEGSLIYPHAGSIHSEPAIRVDIYGPIQHRIPSVSDAVTVAKQLGAKFNQKRVYVQDQNFLLIYQHTET